MKVNKEWAIIKTNRMVLIMNYIICGALTAGYFVDFLKGRKTVVFVILFIGVMVMELYACSAAFRRSKSSEMIKFYSMAGYMLIYCFALFSSDTYFTFVYIFPMTVLYILYYNAVFIKVVGIATVAANFFKVIYQLYWGNTNDTDITSYMVQMACVIVYSVGMYFITNLSVGINREKFNKILEINKSLEQANKSKSNFLASMSHEIRTPMNAIIGITQIQLQRGNLSDEQETALERIYSSGGTLLGIINDILDMSKIETGKMELTPVNYDLPSLINDAVQFNVVRIGSKPIEFICDINENLPSRMYGDEIRLKQILNNLLSNAIKYTEKGHVRLTVKHLAMGEDDIQLCFIVEDTGQGLKPEDKKRLFSEYLRFNAEANRTTEGTGIGLNITKRLTDMMEGDIKVESQYGIGSVFTVKVMQKAVACKVIGPVLSEQLRNFSFTGERRIEKLNIKRELMPYGKVLVVDDVETNLYVAEGLLSAYGLTIETVTSGFAAIKRVESGRCYDVIFMDHMMPLMDGIETTSKLRGMGYHGAIVALSANALVGNDKMFKQNDFDGFISKPIDVRHLNSALNHFIRDKYPEEAAKYKAAYKPETEKSATVKSSVLNSKLLEVFLRDAGKAAVTLQETAANGDIKLFTTTVHAMKSALRNIGEDGIAMSAYALEEAGRNGDRPFISSNAEKFIKTLEALIKKLRPIDAALSDKAVCEDTAYLKEYLIEIKAACEDYNDEAVYAVLSLLKEKPWRTETAAALDKIYDMLFLHSDFEAVSEYIPKLLECLTM